MRKAQPSMRLFSQKLMKSAPRHQPGSENTYNVILRCFRATVVTVKKQ